MNIDNIKTDIYEWCRGKNWWIRIIPLLFFVYVLVSHLKDPLYQTFLLKPLNFAIHEAGHFVFAPLGQFMGIAGGTILQLLAPLLGMVNFIKQRDYYAIALCFGWLSTNFFDVATYAGDAMERSLPLAGGGEYIIHDWGYLLGKFHMIKQCHTVANLFRFAGVISMFICLFAGAWLIYVMFTRRNETIDYLSGGNDLQS